jgi:hypothetical protein
MKKIENGEMGPKAVRASKKNKQPVDPEPKEEGIDAEHPDTTQPVGQSTVVASIPPLFVPGLDAVRAYQQLLTKEPLDAEPREPVGQSTVVATPSIFLGFDALRAYQQARTADPEPREEGFSAERPDITQPVGQSTVVASAAPLFVPGLDAVQQPRTEEPVDDSEPREEGIGVERRDIMEPAGQSTVLAGATASISPGLHEVRANQQPPTEKPVDDSEPREEVGQSTVVESSTSSIHDTLDI